jgi:signal transduction histidine kinase
MRKTKLLIILILSWCSAFSFSAGVPSDSLIQITEEHDFYPLNLASFLLKDNLGLLKIDSVLKLENNFSHITQEIYNFNQDKGVGVYWFRCSLQNLTGKKLREFFCLHPGLDTVESFVFYPDGSESRTTTTAFQLTSTKPFFISRQIILPLELQPGLTKIYLRIVNHSKRSHALNSIIASLADERLFINYVLEFRLFQGIVLGMLLLILVLHIFIYLFIRDATYLVFLVNVFCTFLYLILRKNYHLEFDVLSPLLGIMPMSHDVSGVLISITAIWFTQTFLNTRKEDIVMHRIMNGFMVLQGIVVLFLTSLTWIQLMNLLTIYFGFFSAILMIISSIRSYKRGNKLALYVFFGFILLAFVPLIYIIPMPNYLHYRNDESDLQYIGEAIRSVIFAVGIAHRFYLLKREIAIHEIDKKELALSNEQKLRSEKDRISRDLHDNLGSELAILSMELWQLSKKYPNDPSINSAMLTKASIYNQLRDTIWAIEKNQFKFEDLESRLNTILWKHRNSNIKFKFETSIPDSLFSLTPSQSINLYRIVQEAVQNAVVHSACNEIKISVHANAETGEFYAQVSDDGRGFVYDPESIDKGGHYGLRNMKKRALEVQGQIEIVSKESNGTAVILTFPVKPRD